MVTIALLCALLQEGRPPEGPRVGEKAPHFKVKTLADAKKEVQLSQFITTPEEGKDAIRGLVLNPAAGQGGQTQPDPVALIRILHANGDGRVFHSHGPDNPESDKDLKRLPPGAPGKPATGTDFYINNKPGSGTGTKDDPFGMADLPGEKNALARATQALKPGDTLWFMGGEYLIPKGTPGAWSTPYIRPPGKGGEPGKPISFRAMPGEKVVLLEKEPKELHGQPLMGTGGGQSHVRFEGFTIKLYNRKAFFLTGKVEVAYCDIFTDWSDPKVQGSNPCAVYPRDGDGSWIHHNIIRGGEQPQYGHGLEVYWTQDMIVEDNWVTSLQNGLFDKDSGLNNIYRRNYVHGHRLNAFLGNNQKEYMKVQIYDNVLDGHVWLGTIVDGTDVHDNLILDDTQTGSGGSRIYNMKVWNNITVGKGADGGIRAYHADKEPFTSENSQVKPPDPYGKLWPMRNLEYMDFNLYTAPPYYSFGKFVEGGKEERFGLEEMRKRGFEKNSQGVQGPLEIFEDLKSYKLRAKWAKAGKDGSMPGPDDIASILDTKRYGPDARPKGEPK